MFDGKLLRKSHRRKPINYFRKKSLNMMLAMGINTAMYNKTRVTGHLVTYFSSVSHFDTPRNGTLH